jgi:hypothetical protein
MQQVKQLVAFSFWNLLLKAEEWAQLGAAEGERQGRYFSR